MSNQKQSHNELQLKFLRVRIAINHFKRQLLGSDRHVPGKAQVELVFETLESQAFSIAPSEYKRQKRFDSLGWLGFRLVPRTWEGWFGSLVRVPKRGKVDALDAVAQKLFSWRRPFDDELEVWPAGFYAEAIHGGLLQTMLSATESKIPTIDLLFARARRYKPLSAWHLHLDALEVRAFTTDWCGIPWQEIVDIGSRRILEELHSLWRIEGGSIYRLVSSRIKTQMEASQVNELLPIRSTFQGGTPDLLKFLRTTGNTPSRTLTGISPDSDAHHVHRLLFAIAADTDFLQFDRLGAWAFDFATAGLAANALAWTDRYRILGRQITDEMIFLSAISSLLFSEPSPLAKREADPETAHIQEIDLYLRPAMELTGGDWLLADVQRLQLGRSVYLAELAQLNMQISEVREICGRARIIHPHVYAH